MDFVAKQDFKTPYVVSTGQPHRPTQIKVKSFKKGEIISGEIKTANGKPDFILYKGVMVVPLSCVKQIITKDISVSSVEGADADSKIKISLDKPNKGLSIDKNKRYVDGLLIGAIVGFGGVYLAEKKGWITEASQKNKIIGAVAGAVIGAYVVFRFANKKEDKKINK